MRLLLDTHAFFWLLEDQPRLGRVAREAMTDGGNELYLSLASYWEIAIKHAAGRLELSQAFGAYIRSMTAAHRVELLPVTLDHLAALTALPEHPAEHRDPFDRLLVAQSLHEGMPLVSKDSALDGYPVQRIW